MAIDKDLLIGIVGPCGSGKSTLRAGLEQHGYKARHIAQEHSYVREMWQRITRPDTLIFLDASFTTASQRRKLNWNERDYIEQQRRLAHARANADYYLPTDNLSIQEVLEKVLTFLAQGN